MAEVVMGLANRGGGVGEGKWPASCKYSASLSVQMLIYRPVIKACKSLQ